MSWQIVVQRFLEDVLHHSFCGFKNFLAVCKTHFHINLREFRLAVTACIFIAVAACNLEIFVKSADHKKLLVQLRTLRKGIEFSRMNAAWNKIIACAFRCRFYECRCFDFKKSF